MIKLYRTTVRLNAKMNTLIIILAIILAASILTNIRFYDHYVKPLDYPCVYYKDIKFRTGDLLLFRSLSSMHMWMIGDKFSHVGVVLVINNVPHCLEFQPPNAKLTPLYERLDKYKEGVICVKQLQYDLSTDQNINLPLRISDILSFANNLKYPETFAQTRDVHIKSCITNPWMVKNSSDFDCRKFMLQVLKKLGILQGNEKVACNIATWLSELSYPYGEIKKLSFFDETCLENNGDLWSINSFLNRK